MPKPWRMTTPWCVSGCRPLSPTSSLSLSPARVSMSMSIVGSLQDGMSVDEIAQYLVTELQEPPHQLGSFRKFAESLGPAGVWEVLLETNRIIAEDRPEGETLGLGRKRTAGGIFLKEAIKR